MPETIAELENQLGEARADLHRTLDQVNRKATVATRKLSPEYLVRRNPTLSISGAMFMGFVLGSERRIGAGAFVMGIALALGSLAGNRDWYTR